MLRITQNQLILRAKEHLLKPTKAELAAMKQLRELGIKYKSQQVFGFYILDIVIPERMLVVELDGDYHLGREVLDSKRDAFCNRCGMRVLRLKNGHVSLLVDKLRQYPVVQDYLSKFKQARQRALQEFNNTDRVKQYRTL